MKTNLLIWAPLMALALSACEMPDIPGLNGMPKTTQSMADKMDQTNEAIRMQKMGIALENLEKPENQSRISPVPSGLMAWAQIFGEAATTKELMEFFYLSLKAIDEVNPAKGLDSDGVATNYTDDDKLRVRLQKTASLSGLMAIACFVQDEKVEEIIRHDILGFGRFQKTALNFLALRAAFIRDTMLAQSLNLRIDSPEVLTDSGMMLEALKYLYKLDKISRLPFADLVQVKVQEKQYNLLTFEEKQDAEGRKATAMMWKMALDKSLAGIKTLQVQSWTTDPATNQQKYHQELADQTRAANIMQKYVDSWSATTP